MAVTYEWDVETVTTADTAEHEEGECLEHYHCDSFAEALTIAARPAPDGCEHLIVLVRDDDDGRTWSYVHEGELLPFIDANGTTCMQAPKRFLAEVARRQK